MISLNAGASGSSARPSRSTALRSRWVLLTGSAVMMSLFVLVSFQVRAGGWVTSADQPVLDWFVAHRWAPLNFLAQLVSLVADPVGSAVLAAAAAVFLYLRTKDRVVAAYILGAAALGGVAILVAKHLVDRQRPPLATQLVLETNGSFPSGHLTSAVLVYGSIALALIVTSGARPVRTAVVAVVAMVLVGVDRLYLGVHWFSDLVGATTLGLSLFLLGAAVWLELRRSGFDLRRPAVS
ncbi:PAP2 family protein [Nakamurella silvestris]|nr:PAP2 family protein [Nakamurella silvestris]